MNTFEPGDRLESDYQPETVNTDGWDTLLGELFPSIALVLCFFASRIGHSAALPSPKALWQS